MMTPVCTHSTLAFTHYVRMNGHMRDVYTVLSAALNKRIFKKCTSIGSMEHFSFTVHPESLNRLDHQFSSEPYTGCVIYSS